MIRVGVFGVGGRMGKTVAQAVTTATDMELTGAVDPSFGGILLSELAGLVGQDLVVSRDLAGLLIDSVPLVDVMVDFTHREAAWANLKFCAENGIHAVVGTSGFLEAEYEQIASWFTKSNCLLAPNFAVGAVLMMRFAEIASPFFDTVEIIEMHHDEKIDAPSGTAIGTAERIAAASADWAEDPTRHEVLESARGAKGPADIAIHSVRMRAMTAHQEVLFGTMGQTLTVRHDSYDRSSFMPGVLMAVRSVGGLSEPLTVGLDSILGV